MQVRATSDKSFSFQDALTEKEISDSEEYPNGDNEASWQGVWQNLLEETDTCALPLHANS